MKNLGIVVGYGFDFNLGGRKEIASALRDKGYFVKEVDEPWPRDRYVLLRNKYVNSICEDGSENVFGDGGNVQLGDGFALVSDNAFYFNNIKKEVNFERLFRDKKYYETSKKIISNKGKRQLGVPVYVAPTGYFFGNSSAQGHIDLFTLLLPKNKILIFDNHFGKGANLNKDYNKISEENNLKFIEYSGNGEGVWFPLNSLVLSSPSSEKVVIDSNAKSLRKILEKEGVDFIQVNMPQRSYPAGKINCQTNTFRLKDKDNLRNFFD